MYAIYGDIYHQYTLNVSIYTIHGSYGILKNSSHPNFTQSIRIGLDGSRHVVLQSPQRRTFAPGPPSDGATCLAGQVQGRRQITWGRRQFFKEYHKFMGTQMAVKTMCMNYVYIYMCIYIIYIYIKYIIYTICYIYIIQYIYIYIYIYCILNIIY